MTADTTDSIIDPLADLDQDDADAIAGEWVVIGTNWDDDVTDDEYDSACGRATDWCTEHEGARLSIEFRAARRDEAAGTYQRRADGTLQIHGYTLSIPDVIRDLTDRAWEHASRTWPSEP